MLAATAVNSGNKKLDRIGLLTKDTLQGPSTSIIFHESDLSLETFVTKANLASFDTLSQNSEFINRQF